MKNKFQRHPLMKLIDVCRSLGVSVKFTGEPNTYYEKQTVFLAINSYDFTRDNIKHPPSVLFDLAHELAHYLLAKPGQRKLPDYSFKGGGERRSVQRKIYEDGEEDKTRFIESLILKKLKVSYRYRAIEVIENDHSKQERRWPVLGWWLDRKEQYIDLVNLLF